MASAQYKSDIIAWANEQAAFIRAGKFDQLDLENIAEEIEDVGKSEQRELESRLEVLLAHLLKWKFQTAFRSKSWERTIIEQRARLRRAIKKAPSLKALLNNKEFLDDIYEIATITAINETGLETYPKTCDWSLELILQENWLPE
ncbi:MAG: DUF29 domain-containing protein [Methylophilaceae bacterium]